MANRERFIGVLLSILLSILFLGALPQLAANRHHGLVVDFNKHTPAFAEIVAYGSNRRITSEGGCPRFADLLVSTRSNQETGAFRLDVSANVQSYLATFCASGYYPRVESSMANFPDGTPVIPFPVKLMTTDPDFEHYRGAVESEVNAFVSTIRYLRAVRGSLLLDVLATMRSRVETEAERDFLDAVQRFVERFPSS